MLRALASVRAVLSVSMPVTLALASVVLLLAPRASFAQTDRNRASRWAVSFSFSPSWKIHSAVENLFAEEDETLLFKGQELTLGIGRGSLFGGDWGVSFLRKPFDDGVALSSTSSDCFEPGQGQPEICLSGQEQKIFENVQLTGVEVHWFIAIVRIKDRVQVGVNVAGGIGTFSGTVLTVRDDEFADFVPGPPCPPDRPPGCGQPIIRIATRHEEEREPASDALLPYFPLGKVELQGAVILGPSLKVKVGGGFNFPGTGARIAVVYLF
jgi:hypothetical protein